MKRRPIHGRQHGAALVMGLIFLVLISLIAAVGMRQSVTQERMAGGLRNDSLARGGAETAARAGERRIYDFYLTSNGAVLVGDAACSRGVCRKDSVTARNFRDAAAADFFTTGAQTVSTSLVDFGTTSEYTARLAEQPVFVIEDLDRVRPQGAGGGMEGGATGTENYQGQGAAGNNDHRLYRITARSTGGLETVVRTVQTTYVARSQG